MSAPASRRRIELIQTLGQGGFGAVYLADVHGRDDFVQRLAIKVLNEEMSAQPDIAARQRDEARLLARLNHDHIVRVVDLTELQGRPAVLMEYVEGADCAELLRRGPVPVVAALQIGSAAASALDAAWSSVGPRSGLPLRVIHRDIKPANLLVSRHGGVKVLDFGVARADFDREGKTGSVQFGTARYMSPEQWLYGSTSHKVDVYALGVSLVEILSGLHMERAPLAPEAFAAHMQAVRGAVRAPEWPEELSQAIDALLAGMLAFEPEARPDAAQVCEELARLAEWAPGESLRRWALRVVPGIVEEQRVRWARVPPPDLSQAWLPEPGAAALKAAGLGAAGLGAAGLGATGLGATGTGRTEQGPALAATGPTSQGAAAPADGTLALPITARPGRAVLPALVGGLAALGVLGLGAVLVLPRLRFEASAVQAEPVEAGQTQAGQTQAGQTELVAPSPPPEAAAEATPELTPEASPEPAAAAPPASPNGSTGGSRSSTAAPASRALPAPSPSSPSPSSPSPSVPEAAPPSTPAAATATMPVTLSSRPWGATVSVDGRSVGTAPLSNLPLSIGSHTVTMHLGADTSTRTIAVGGHNPTNHSWIVETDEWHSSQ